MLIQVWALEQGEEASLSRRKKLETATLSAASGTTDADQDVFVPWTSNVNPKKSEASAPAPVQPVHKRYYHLFRKDELRQLCLEAARDLGLHHTVQVVDGGWERGNWWIQLKRSTR